MSFGVFSSKFGSDDVSLDMAIAHEHPDYSAGAADEFMTANEGDAVTTEEPLPAPPLIQPSTLPNVFSDIPWALVVPAAVIGVAVIGIGWYMLSGKKVEIPI